MTVVKKTAGDIVLGGVENLITKPIAVGVDYLSSLTRSAMSFGEKSPSDFREFGNALTPQGVSFGAKGWLDGAKAGLELVRTGIDPDEIPDVFNVQRVNYDNPVINGFQHGVMNVLHASVKPWYGLAMNLSLYARAVAAAAREGLEGEAASTRIDELLAAPTDEMSIGAIADAEYMTLTNKTIPGQIVSRTKSWLRATSENPDNGVAARTGAGTAYVASEAMVPFSGVPSAIGGVIRDYSPLGAVKTLRMLIAAAGKDAPVEPGLQAQLSLRASRAIVGSSLIGLGYYMARKGSLTGSYPTDPGERARWQAEGKQPYSFYMNGEWHSLTGVAPLGLLPLVGADVESAAARGIQRGSPLDWEKQTAVGVGSMGKVLTEQSFLKGVSAITDALNDPERSGARTAAGVLTSPVPTIAKQFWHGIDPTVRQATSFPDLIKAQIPGAMSTLPPKLDQFGNPMTRGSGGGATGVARELLDITRTHAATPNAALEEMDRLGVGLPTFGKGLTLPGKKPTTLTPDEYNAKVKEFGPIKLAMVTSMIQEPWYQALPDDEKKLWLEKNLRAVQDMGNNVTKGRKLGIPIPLQTPASIGIGKTP